MKILKWENKKVRSAITFLVFIFKRMGGKRTAIETDNGKWLHGYNIYSIHILGLRN